VTDTRPRCNSRSRSGALDLSDRHYGSAGKTTTKEMIARSSPRSAGPTSRGANFNNQIGAPLCLDNGPDDRGGRERDGNEPCREIAQIASLLRRDRVYTNIAPVHIEFSGHRERLPRRKRDSGELAAPATVVVQLR